MKKILKIVFVIIASFVGAGFASGKEIYEFFFIYGKKGIQGIAISFIIISLVIYKVLKICKKNKINSYSEFCFCIVNQNKFFSIVLNNIINIFLLVSFFIMISGFSSLLQQEFNINKIVGTLIIVSLIILVLLKNVNGLVKISNYLIPIFVFFLLIIMIKDSNYLNFLKNPIDEKIIKYVFLNNWFIKSILYASYNCTVLIPVIVLISEKIKNEKSCMCISIITLMMLIILSISVFNLLTLGDDITYSLEMPIISIMQKYSNMYRIIYIFLIAISIITTAISEGLSFLNNTTTNRKKYIKNLIIISFIAIPVSQISFGTLVKMLYPALGLIGFGELILILKLNFTKKNRNKNTLYPLQNYQKTGIN